MFKYLHMAAERDYFLAFYALGREYYESRRRLFGSNGDNIHFLEPDEECVELLKKSIYWFRKAAEHGLIPLAVNRLRLVYLRMWLNELWQCFCFKKYITKHHEWFEENLTRDRKNFPELENLNLRDCWFA